MGARLCALAGEDPNFVLVGAVERPRSSVIGTRIVSGGHTSPLTITDSGVFSGDFRADVVIDFSSSDGANEALALSRKVRAALLVGTTALASMTVAALRRAAADQAVLVAPNTSKGVAVTAAMVEIAARLLGGSSDCSIVESHHRAKKDAPSGTALRLADAALAGGLQVDAAQVVSVRGGDVIGEHTVRFASQGEYLEITHRATSRDLFARGALDAAKWLVGRGPGWWTMNDVLGLAAR